MKLIVLGSGGCTPTPRPFCGCPTCKKARELGEPYKRNSSSLFVNEILTLIDCLEDIADSLNRGRINKVDNLFITHWHPDHTFGLRPVLETCFNFLENKPNKKISVCMPRRVAVDLKQHYPSVSYFADRLRVADINQVEQRAQTSILISHTTAWKF